MSPSPSELMLQVIGKIPLFKGFSPTQVRLVLGMCEHQALEGGKILCEAEKPAEYIFMLVAGELARLGKDGKPLERILPVVSVGEVQVMTGRPHNAAIQAARPSHVFAIPRFQFERMLRRDPEAQTKVYKNLAEILVSQVKNEESDRQLAALREAKQQSEARIVVLERQLHQRDQKLEVAFGLLCERTNMTRTQVENYLGEKLKDLLPRVLIVDDEPEFRRFVRETLSSFTVLEAGSGREALEIVLEEQLNLIIADIRMPEMDGCALLDNLRSKFPGLPVLAVSGYLGAEDLQHYDFDGFIDKPVKPQRLLEIVETALARIT